MPETYPEKVCPRCKTPFEELQYQHKAGCEYCYDYFSELGGRLEQLLRAIHGRWKHKEGLPFQPAETEELLRIDLQIRELEMEMERLIQEERFEEAIVYRDKIQELQERRQRAQKSPN